MLLILKMPSNLNLSLLNNALKRTDWDDHFHRKFLPSFHWEIEFCIWSEKSHDEKIKKKVGFLFFVWMPANKQSQVGVQKIIENFYKIYSPIIETNFNGTEFCASRRFIISYDAINIIRFLPKVFVQLEHVKHQRDGRFLIFQDSHCRQEKSWESSKWKYFGWHFNSFI